MTPPAEYMGKCAPALLADIEPGITVLDGVQVAAARALLH